MLLKKEADRTLLHSHYSNLSFKPFVQCVIGSLILVQCVIGSRTLDQCVIGSFTLVQCVIGSLILVQCVIRSRTLVQCVISILQSNYCKHPRSSNLSPNMHLKTFFVNDKSIL